MASQPETKYFMLDAASIPSADECGAANDRMKYAKKLRSMAKTSGPDGTCETAMGVDEVGFAKGSAATVAPISLVKDIDISIRLFIFFTSFLWIPGLIIYFTLIIPTLFGWVMVGITVLLYFAPPRWLPKVFLGLQCPSICSGQIQCCYWTQFLVQKLLPLRQYQNYLGRGI